MTDFINKLHLPEGFKPGQAVGNVLKSKAQTPKDETEHMIQTPMQADAAGKPGAPGAASGEQLNLDVDEQKGINAELGLVGGQVNEQKQGGSEDEVKQDESGDIKQDESGNVLGESTDVKQDENGGDAQGEEQAKGKKQVQGEKGEEEEKVEGGKQAQGEEQVQRTEEIHEKELQDRELAQRIALLIENSNARIAPLLSMVHQAIDQYDAQKDEDDKDEKELVGKVRPPLEQAEAILNETNGAIRALDPDGRLADKVKRRAEQVDREGDKPQSVEERRLAEALKVMVKDVKGTVDWAHQKLNNCPKAKRDLGPLLDALSQPLTQIIGAVGLLLSGVLGLLGNLLQPLGLDGFLHGVVGALGLDSILRGFGLGRWLGKGRSKN